MPGIPLSVDLGSCSCNVKSFYQRTFYLGSGKIYGNLLYGFKFFPQLCSVVTDFVKSYAVSSGKNHLYSKMAKKIFFEKLLSKIMRLEMSFHGLSLTNYYQKTNPHFHGFQICCRSSLKKHLRWVNIRENKFSCGQIFKRSIIMRIY